MEKAKEMGFEYLATGHYANISTTQHKSSTTHELIEAKDKNKDQTYFLHQLTQDQLEHALFPIGGYTKPQVRALARKFKLPTAERAESMGICFVGEIPMKDFLQQKIQPKPGNIVLSTGEVVGEHDGLSFYTIGQRHGFDLSLRGGVRTTTKQSTKGNKIASFPAFDMSSGRMVTVTRNDSKPLFVVGKNQKKNELVVGYEDDALLWKKEIEVGEVNWVLGQASKFPLECKVRLRHRQTLQNCIVEGVGGGEKGVVRVVFDKPQKAVTPGQFAVFYSPRGELKRALRGKDNQCLGGGVIV